MSLRVSRSRFLEVVRALALVSPFAAACGGTAPLANSGGAAPSASATVPVQEGGDPAATGPCRCSWDTNAAAAPRVCKKGEPSYEGDPCTPGSHPSGEGGSGGMPTLGPLSPPDLA